LIAGFFLFNSYIYNGKQANIAFDYKNAEYIIDGQRVGLENGVAQTKVSPDSDATITTSYFGNELSTDLNNDGREDVVFILTQDTVGSGTFYYVASAINTTSGYVGSQAYLLGDRISPQKIELSGNPLHDRVIVVEYVDRNLNDPMTEVPSIEKSVWIKLDVEALQFGVVESNFSGESDSLRSSDRVRTYLDGSATALSVTIEPQKVITDSRCPVGLECVRAGSVEVSAIVSSLVSHGELVFRLGETQDFGDYLITLLEVLPVKREGSIEDSEYRFIFDISARIIDESD